MKKFISIITNRWFLQFIGVLCIALIIWFVGPFMAVKEVYFLESDFSRLLTIIVIVALWGANIWRIKYREKKRNEKLMDDLSKQPEPIDPSLQASEEEQSIISERFAQAIKVLKESNVGSNKKGSQYLYELPWYIFIGPPGSGKTTALVHSGIKFPLAEQLGNDAIQGIGGTRNCDWWFTDEAVLIDTAGRFTTQDSHEAVDRAAWQQFMNLLKRNRPQQPINGAIVTMSMSDLMQQSDEQRLQTARTIRRRMEELYTELGIRFPVYFTFTKCDLIPGFSEFFGSLDLEARNQVWGETFGLDNLGNSTFDLSQIPNHFAELSERLQVLLINRLRDERDPQKKTLIVGFPAQFASLNAIASSFLQEVFSDNRYNEGALLRGIYYTSGTQSGTPIDRLLGSLAENLGFNNSTMVGNSGKGKSYFIHDLLRKVIFAEKGIAGLDMSVVRRRKLIQRVSDFSAFCLIILGGLSWGYSYLNNNQRIDDTNLLIANLAGQQVSGHIIGSDFETILPELNTLRDATQVYNDTGIDHKLGLYQGDKLSNGALQAYHKRLRAALLPMLVARLEELILDNDRQNTDTLYELLRAYLMYANIKPYDAELLTFWAVLDWQETFSIEPQVADQLSLHMQVLMDEGFIETIPNEEIVTYARKILSKDSLEKQVYLAIKRELLPETKYQLESQDILGPYAGDVFEFHSQQSIENFRMASIFTKSGFYKLFLPTSVKMSQQYLDNNWVMGPTYAAARNVDISKLRERILNLYYEEYIQHWDAMIADLRAKPTTTAEDGVRQVNLVSGLDSPLRYLLESITKETTLSKFTSGSAKGTEEVTRAVASVSTKLEVQQQRVSRLLRNAKKAGLTVELGKRVEQHFSKYHKLLTVRGNSSVLDRLLRDLGALGEYLDDAAQSAYSSTGSLEATKGRLTKGANDPIKNIDAYKNVLPAGIQDLVSKMGSSNWEKILDNSKQELQQLWKTNVYDECRMLVAGRYPLNRNATSDATLEDFSDFFAPEGILDLFVADYLQSFLDTRGKTWKERSLDGQKIGISKNSLVQLQRAAKIRDIFFRKGQLQVPFSVKVINMQTNVSKFELKVGEQELVYRHGPIRSIKMNWPSESDEIVGLSFEDENGILATSLEDGPWALFRMLNTGRLTKTKNKSVYNVNFAMGNQSINLQLRAKSVINPFSGNLLASFKCVEKL